jgi:hypothetical protein
LKCGYCHELIDEDEYRNHVINCSSSDEEGEDQPVLEVCSLCKKQVKNLTEYRKTCPDGDDETNHTYKNRQSSPASSVRSHTLRSFSIFLLSSDIQKVQMQFYPD